MAFLFVALATLVSIASAGLVPAAYSSAPAHSVSISQPLIGNTVLRAAAPVYQAQPLLTKTVGVAQPLLAKNVEINDPHPQYNYAYEVHDALSGDSKSQVESRDGDIVKGQYSLIDADGYKRTVDYSADPINGFNAVVNREPIVSHAVKAVAPVAHVASPVVASPAYSYAAAPAYTAYAAAPTVVKSHSLPLAAGSSLVHSAPRSYVASPVAYNAGPVYYSGHH